MNIYVGNLSYSTNEEELKTLFEQFGEVESATIISDKFRKRSKGFGFVEMKDDTNANEAIKNLDGKDFRGRNLKVNEAKPKRDDNRY